MRLIDFEPLYERAVELEEQSLSYLRDKGVADEDFRVWSAVLAERTAFKHNLVDAPIIDAAPVKHGRWTEVHDNDKNPFLRQKFYCSACGDWNTYGESRYCPKCGAKMDGGDHNAFD